MELLLDAMELLFYRLGVGLDIDLEKLALES
jgi:hypothetical protein